MKCRVCGQLLRFVVGKGYLHPNGELYITRQEKRACLKCGGRVGLFQDVAGKGCVACDGTGMRTVTLDDHCAQPVPV
jgi:hypothetical protein